MLNVTCCRSDTPMTELSVFTDSSTPQGFIVNDEAKNEMLRIGRAAHLNHEFKIFQPTFFSLDQNETTAQQPSVHSSQSIPVFSPDPQDPLSSLFSLNSTTSGSLGIGSSRSVDSNISQTSVPSTTGTRWIKWTLFGGGFLNCRTRTSQFMILLTYTWWWLKKNIVIQNGKKCDNRLTYCNLMLHATWS